MNQVVHFKVGEMVIGVFQSFGQCTSCAAILISHMQLQSFPVETLVLGCAAAQQGLKHPAFLRPEAMGTASGSLQEVLSLLSLTLP